MMLSLFQETDSTSDGSLHAFYQEREWRLVLHMRQGMRWYCLGEQPWFRNPLANARRREIRYLRDLVELVSGQPRDEAYFRNCWLLESVDGAPIRSYIASVIAPSVAMPEVRTMLATRGCAVEPLPAEEFGYED
jgi:hypothetical protein